MIPGGYCVGRRQTNVWWAHLANMPHLAKHARCRPSPLPQPSPTPWDVWRYTCDEGSYIDLNRAHLSWFLILMPHTMSISIIIKTITFPTVCSLAVCWALPSYLAFRGSCGAFSAVKSNPARPAAPRMEMHLSNWSCMQTRWTRVVFQALELRYVCIYRGRHPTETRRNAAVYRIQVSMTHRKSTILGVC